MAKAQEYEVIQVGEDADDPESYTVVPKRQEPKGDGKPKGGK